jgi:hypothetical protein
VTDYSEGSQPLALFCDDCGYSYFDPPEFLRKSTGYPCCLCGVRMREVRAPLPSLQSLSAMSPNDRLRLVLLGLARCRDVLDQIDKGGGLGWSRAAIMMDYARDVLAGRSSGPNEAVYRGFRELVMYLQVAQNPLSQAIADALISLYQSVHNSGRPSPEVAQRIVWRCLFATGFEAFRLKSLEEDGDQLNAYRGPLFRVAKLPEGHMTEGAYDAFISYAHEDADTVARPLVAHLNELGSNVWFDEVRIGPGDDLRGSITLGTALSRAGVAIISKTFLAKQWPRYELETLLAENAEEKKPLLSIWYGVAETEIQRYSVNLASMEHLIAKDGDILMMARRLHSWLSDRT